MKKILAFLFLLASFCIVPVIAQKKSAAEKELATEIGRLKKQLFPYAENQCEGYGKEDFIGGEMLVELVNVDLQGVLGFITDIYGCRFVIEKSAENTLINVKKININSTAPWDVALCSALKANGLAVQFDGLALRVSEAKDPEAIVCGNSENGLSKSPLYTEFVKLKNLYLKTRPLVCWGNAPKVGSAEYETSDKLFFLLRKMLSRRGAIEHDDRNGILIITDQQSRIKIIAEFVKLLDESGFTPEEIVNNPNLEIK
jgi:type II secretory pathway component GspD/PulD (secretin)